MNTSSPSFDHRASKVNLLELLKQWLDQLEIHDRHIAQRIVKSIPAQCPFQRHITCFGRSIAHIPPLCKLNPFYEQLAGLRFRALCCLAEEWGEDISAYC
jgi:Mo-dependent nitrogenase C-terminus